MIVTVKKRSNRASGPTRAFTGVRARGACWQHKKTRQNIFSSRKFEHISTLPVSPPEDISTRQLAAEVFEHASICSPAWELEFISTIAQFLNTLRSVRLHITHRTHRSVRLHASICSPAWELEFISTIAQFLSSLRSVRLHRKPSTVSFDFRLQWERKRIIGSLGQLWNALTSAPGAKNELLNGGLSSRFFFLRLYTKLKHDHNRITIHDFSSQQ